MPKLENVRLVFPDSYGINASLRKGVAQNPEFLDLALKAHAMLAEMKGHDLSIADSLRANENVSIFDHQILAAQRVKNRLGGTAMLADEVGLGKTVEAGIIIKELLVTGLARRVLILAPPSLLPQWRDEMHSKFDMDFVEHGGPQFKDVQSHDLLIMSHSSAVFPNQSKPLNDVYWDLVIVDEAHSMKNSETRKHKLVRGLPKRHLLLLTATPLQNNLEELYNLVDLLRPGHLGTWAQFKEKYVADDRARRLYASMRGDLQRILSEIVVRTTRGEVKEYIRFTERIPHTEILEPTEPESFLYDAITEIVRDLYVTEHDPFPVMTYQRLASSSIAASKRALYKMKANEVITLEAYEKLVAVADSVGTDSKMSKLLDTMRGNDEKFLVFTEFYATQDYVAERLAEAGHTVTLFNGRMGPDEKAESVGRFRGGAQVMVSTSAGGEGQNFQFCHNIVNYDLPWNPMKVEQRIGRVHRIGQEEDVRVFNYALKGTIESYILELLYSKIDLFRMALGEMDLLFEDSWSGGSQQAWFKMYMDSASDDERRNRFSSLGDDWKSRKEVVGEAVQNFNSEVFGNFDLSTLGDKDGA